MVDNASSDISEEELEMSFGNWDEEKCVEFTYQELVKLAARAREGGRRWFERVIGKMPDGLQKMKLREVLAK